MNQSYPQKRRVPKRTSEEAESHHHETPKDHYRQIYFEVFDVICNEISRQFDQKDFKLVSQMEQIILSAGNGEKVTIPEDITTTYANDLSMERLFTHLQMLQDIIKNYSELTGSQIKKLQMCVLCVKQ